MLRPNPFAIVATFVPILPRPIIPRDFPPISVPTSSLFLHSPPRSEVWALDMFLQTDRRRVKVSSATLDMDGSGELTTNIPLSVAAMTSILSVPTPARAITLSFIPLVMISESTFVLARTTKA